MSFELRDEAHELIDSELTVDVCNRIVEIIRLLSQDDEVAHCLEDDFREAVLKTIDHPFAKIALKTSNIDFSRWHA